MREDLGYTVKDVSDKEHAELSPKEIYDIFIKRYKDYTPVFSVKGCHFRQEDGITATVNIIKDDRKNLVESTGNGSDSNAIAYVGIRTQEGKLYFGIGIDPDILRASIDALITAMNRSME